MAQLTMTFRILVTLGFCVASAACTQPYRKPLTDPPEARFDGVYSILSASGVADTIPIHGMCTHDLRWVKGVRREMLSALPGWSVGLVEEFSVGDVDVHVSRFSETGSDRTINNYAIVWSRLTTPRKQQLCYDTSEPTPSCPGSDLDYERTRAKLNSSLKSELLNDCLSDAVIYAGASGTAIRDAVRSTIDAIGTKRRATVDAPLALVSESLGSKILLDALLDDSMS